MARKPTNTADENNKLVGKTENPETAKQENVVEQPDAVKDLPPSNKFGEPIAKEYPTGENAEVTQATLKPAETIVEHPLSPTDSNPNPHGNRDEPGLPSVPVKDKDGNVTVERAEDGDTEIEGTSDNAVHLGDGRTLAKGQKAKVSKEVAKQLRDNGQAK